MKKKMSAWLAAWLLLGLVVVPASAARTIPVTVNGALMSGAAYLEDGVTAVPLRSLCDALGGWQVSWDSTRQCAIAVSGSKTTISATPGERTVTVNGTVYETAFAIYIQSGRTYIPLRIICHALGLSVVWDRTLGGAAVSTGAAVNYSSDDLYWLSHIISAESGGESLTGQIAVGNVVLNRVASSEFPNTIQSVIFDRTDGVQFEPVSNGSIYDTPTALSVTAAKAALAGTRPVGRCLYFYAPALSQGIWINANRTYYTTIGCHRFYL
jgi:N-acetylmuramoyl-L-alanine amidase